MSAYTCEASLPFTVNVIQPTFETFEVSVCKGSDFNNYGFNLTNIQKDTICYLEEDCSKSTLYVTIKYDEIELKDTVCSGVEYTNNGFTLSDVQRDTVCYREENCKKYVLLLTALNNTETQLMDTICSGMDYFKDGFSIHQPIKDTICIREENCHKSILNLYVNPIKETHIYESVCEGSSYTKMGFNASEVGEYKQTLQAKCGCDSVVTLHLNVLPNTPITLKDDFCTGAPYSGRGYDNLWISQDTILQRTASIQGCLSDVVLYLTAHNPSSTQLVDSIKKGERYTKYNYDFVAQYDTVVIQSLNSISNCDSVITLKLTVYEEKKVNEEDDDEKEEEQEEQEEQEKQEEQEEQEKQEEQEEQENQGEQEKEKEEDRTDVNKDTLSVDSKLYIPVFFTPNGDGSNDRWIIRNLQNISEAVVEIFDRYGRRLLMFSSSDAEAIKGWDGYYNGHMMPQDDYWYVITIANINKRYSGHFTLKR